MISPHPPRLRMKGRKTVSVTPAIGASTVAGAIWTPPIERLEGTGFTGHTSRAEPSPTSLKRVPAPLEPTPPEPFVLSQNFFTVLFYLCFSTCPRKTKAPAVGEGLVPITGVNRAIRRAKGLLLRRHRSGSWCGRVILSVLAAEALHASGGVHQLLLASKERMTGR